MAKNRRGPKENEIAELLRDQFISQLALAGVRQQAIRAIVGCDINRVSRIYKQLRPALKKSSD